MYVFFHIEAGYILAPVMHDWTHSVFPEVVVVVCVSVDLSWPSDLIASLFFFSCPPAIHHLHGPSCHSSLTSDLSPRPRLGGCFCGNMAVLWPLSADRRSLNYHDDHNLLPLLTVYEYHVEREKDEQTKKDAKDQQIDRTIAGCEDRWMTEQKGACHWKDWSFGDEFTWPCNRPSYSLLIGKKRGQLSRGGFV